MNKRFSLAGKTALVTGANTGIGQAISVSLAQAGARVICAGRSSMSQTIEMIEGKGGAATALNLDLSKPMLAKEVFSELEPVNLLINNAGIIRRNDATDFSEADWDDVLDVNLKAVFFLSQAFANAALERNDGGKIVTSPRCCHSRAAFGWRLIQLQKRNSWFDQVTCERMGS